MPRNSSGDYSLPAGNPVQTGTPIAISWANGTMTDLGTALTDSLSRSGDGGMLAPLELDSGAVGAPGLAFGAETALGLYRVSAGHLGFAAGGSKVMDMDATGLAITGVLSASGAVALASTLNVVGNFSVATNKFNVTAASGNTAIAGTLAVTLGATFSSTASFAGIATFTANPSIDVAGSAALGIQGTTCRLNLIEDDQGVDEQRFRLDLAAKIVTLEFVSDDLATTRTIMSSTRGTGVAVSTITIGNTTDNPTLNIRADIVEFNDGSESAPVITNSGDENTGFYFPSADEIGFSLGGTGYLIGYRNLPDNNQNGNYTAVLTDSGKMIRKSAGGAGETYTIPSNASVAYPLGTVLTFVNMGGGALTIAITTDTLTWAADGSTGSRTLADNGLATAIKVATTEWLISGTGLS
jgi:hypothetical protein